MKKHSLTMVFLLILTLTLMGVVSAGDNQTQAVPDSQQDLSQGELQMEMIDQDLYGDSVSDGLLESAVQPEVDEQISVCDSEVQYSVIEQGTDFENNVATQDNDFDESPIGECDDDFESHVAVPDDDFEIHADDYVYDLGYEITTDFSRFADFTSDEILVITNAGFYKINDKTTENVLNGIIDASNGYITYNEGNLITLSSNNDSMKIAFFVKNRESFTIAFYKNESTTPLYYGNASPELAAGLWNDVKTSDCVLNILNSWTNSFLDDLTLATYPGCVSTGLLSENKIRNVMYPQDLDLPLEYALGVSGDFDDDAFICKSIDTSDEMASFAVDMVNKSNAGFSNNSLKSAKHETEYVEDLSSGKLVEIGVNASNKALNYFSSQGIDVQKDYSNLFVVTSAGHVKFDGKSTRKVLDGLSKYFYKKNVISAEVSLKDLLFYFIDTKPKNHIFISYALKYELKTGRLAESGETKNMIDDMILDMLFGDDANEKTGHVSDYGGENYVSAHDDSEKVNSTSVHNSNSTKSANATHKGNISKNETNSTKNVTDYNQKPLNDNSSPFNIAYTLAAILIICVIFGSGYRKR